MDRSWRDGDPVEAWPLRQRAVLLARVRRAIRGGMVSEAQSLLDSAGRRGAHDAACLNLMGVVHEARKQWSLARRFYGRAMRAGRSYEAAQQNMRRWYELYTFGHSRQAIALGDEIMLPVPLGMAAPPQRRPLMKYGASAAGRIQGMMG